MSKSTRTAILSLCCLGLAVIGISLGDFGQRAPATDAPGIAASPGNGRRIPGPAPSNEPPDRRENPHSRAMWEYNRLRNPATGIVPPDMHRREREFAGNLPRRETGDPVGGLRAATAPDGTTKMDGWVNRGPHNIGGRTRAIAIDVSDPTYRTLFAGGVTGGLWRTTDDGATWSMVVGSSHLHYINSIAQDTRPGHENVWYYGTGEGNKTTLEYAGRAHRGDGIFKSIDGGLTWNVLPATATYTPQTIDNPFNYIGNIAIDTSNLVDDELYAATYGAIQRSLDGGDTWTVVLGDPSQPSHYSDVIIDSEGVLYASLSSDGAVHGIFRSTDGLNWTDLTPPIAIQNYGRIALGSVPSDEAIVNALIADPTTSANCEFWRYKWFSGDGTGSNGFWADKTAALWQLEALPWYPEYPTHLTSQRGYNLHVTAAPDTHRTIYLGGVHLWRSTNAYMDDTQTARVGGYYYEMETREHHADQHALIVQPGSSEIAYTASDGGVHKTLDMTAESVTWTSLNNGYNTTQFYTIAVDQDVPGDPIVAGGTQDNGTLWTNSASPTADWVEILGGDGAHCTVIDAAAGEYLASWYRGNTMRLIIDAAGNVLQETKINPAGAGEFLFINPSLSDPVDEHVLYMGTSNGLWRNDDYTAIPWDNWDPTSINWVHVTTAPVDDYICALASNAQAGHALYFGTTTGGLYRVDSARTASVGTSPVALTGNAAFPAGAWVTGIAVHPFDDQKVLACFGNYEVASLWYSDDGGASWADVEGNLGGADGPSVRCVAIHSVNGGDMWMCGTSIGLFSSLPRRDGQTLWVQESPDDIGTVIVEAITIRPSDGLIAVATYGRGIFTANMPTVAEVPNATTVARLAQNVPNPFNPSTEIAFELPVAGRARVEVFNPRGQLVRTLLDEVRAAGPNTVSWNGRDGSGRPVAAGTYIYRLVSGDVVEQKTMTLVK